MDDINNTEAIIYNISYFIDKLFLLMSEHIVAVLIFILLITQKKSISDLISRLTNFSWKKGDSSIDVGACYPHPEVEKSTTNGKLFKPELKHDEEDKIISTEIDNKDENSLKKMYIAFFEGRIEDAKKIFAKYQIREDLTTHDIKVGKAMYLSLLFSEGKDNTAIAQLEKLANSIEDETTKHEVSKFLTRCLKDSSQLDHVIKIWRKAITTYTKDILVTKATANLAIALKEDEEYDEAKDLLVKRLNEISSDSDEEKAILYDVLSEIEKSLGNNKLAVYCKDKSIEYDPLNRGMLFDTAYFGSEQGVKSITLSNYATLVDIDPKHESALNNLGVEASNEDLDIQAVNYYKKSSEQNNTLAMANEGNKLLNAGFAKEAKELAQKALKMDDTHTNIYTLLSDIEKREEEEAAKWDTIISNAEKQQKYLREYVSAYYLNTSNIFDGNWELSNKELVNIEVIGDQLEITWQEIKSNDTYNIKITGTITNSSFSGVYLRKIDDPSKANSLLLSSAKKEINCLGIMSDDGYSLKIVSSDNKQELSIKLKR